ncbi:MULTISPECIES: hypothetical protein [unclassified Paenibacillus]|uniref:hypothetical protein n=2 Tax=Paenibacillus TaxID=44249 RepID=UPI0009A5FB83|nr:MULTISPECIES: hypothetical protein [unclassified Paenibacillus]SLK16815.1 hypothetical protein SAMN06272722_110259 [Paenibacillus sp. RU5A]SOC74492.1 hypothetical protein SAMN05880581_110259 [Paenibacillus sp. RU26A]SOC76680.1 hypothetical protein SAMN05880586_110259 [Paenibacillus sp. RU5M]
MKKVYAITLFLFFSILLLTGCMSSKIESEIEYSNLQLGVISDIQKDMRENNLTELPVELTEMKSEIQADLLLTAKTDNVQLPADLIKEIDKISNLKLILETQRLERLASQSHGASVYALDKLNNEIESSYKHIYLEKIEREFLTIAELESKVPAAQEKDFGNLAEKKLQLARTEQNLEIWAQSQRQDGLDPAPTLQNAYVALTTAAAQLDDAEVKVNDAGRAINQFVILASEILEETK